MHDRVLRPTDTGELYDGGGYTSVFSDLTVDLTPLASNNAFTVRANTIFGDLTVIVPKDSELTLDSTVAWSDIETFGEKLGFPIPLGPMNYSEGRASAHLKIRLEVFSAFGSVKVVRQAD